MPDAEGKVGGTKAERRREAGFDDPSRHRHVIHPCSTNAAPHATSLTTPPTASR